jgi:DNA-binding MarR family transcriptional regulator
VSPAPTGDHRDGVAFLLAQLGYHAAELFAERIAPLGLNPPQAGILRAIATGPGRSQQALSQQLNLLPSRVVAFVDDLENRGYVERRRNPDDRRLHALYLTASGKKLMQKLSELARAHEREVTAALSDRQHAELRELLAQMASQAGLAPQVHPGYHGIGRVPGAS